ncbi:hypothetical protein K353_00050 [Kitasatospora sp. SolWspMP-SS2h]|nr:hypothetical protein [Kitasatospora sp. SolWspMP-SS2h]RAJ46849.1 hypothetical protein K353_00050 [Kitasatospora sp. SolWspMP-SS2h]
MLRHVHRVTAYDPADRPDPTAPCVAAGSITAIDPVREQVEVAPAER